jgi:trk system potassium uptake protein TrkA
VYIIIVGGGKVGYYLAKTLAPDKHRITLIEEDFQLCEKIACELIDLGGSHPRRRHGHQVFEGCGN